MTLERELHAVANPIFVRALGVQPSVDRTIVNVPTTTSSFEAPAAYGFSSFSTERSRTALQSN